MRPLFYTGEKMKLSAYRESKEKQLKGVPVFVGDSVFYLKRWGTKESQEFVRELKKKLFGPFHKDSAGDENILISEWLIEYGCVGWEGVLQENADEEDETKWYFFFDKMRDFFGKKKITKPEVKELQYSKERARNIFSNEEYFMSLNAVLFTAATNFENYLYDDADADAEQIKKN